MFIDSRIARDDEVFPIVLANDGFGSLLDADLLDGEHGAFYQNASNIDSGILSELFIDRSITRDSEVIPIVLANDGPGSGIDADLVDGQQGPFVDLSNSQTIGGAKTFTSSVTVNGSSLLVNGANGSTNVIVGFVGGSPNNGAVAVYDRSGSQRAAVLASGSGPGTIFTDGSNSSTNVNISWLSGFPNHGFISVQDAGATTQAGMYVDSSGDGVVFADIKSFRIPNPKQPGTEIWYTALEGPEAAAYIRGTGQLVNGRTIVTFPDHFLAVASPQGMTVQLTPLSADSKGLAVVEKSLNGLVVQELHSGTGTYDFDYLVTAVRKGYEDFQVIRSALEGQPALTFEAADAEEAEVAP